MVSTGSTNVFQAAVAEAEELVRGASFVKTEQDLADGLDYLAGSIRASLQMAWAYQPEHPFFVNSTSQHTKMGLDNPDTIYYHANLRPDSTYVVRGRRGSTVDLSFQVLGGDYTPSSTPDGSTAFDDRDLEIGPDGEFELSFGPAEVSTGSTNGRHHVVLPETAAMLAVREVYDDWAADRGTVTIHRADTLGVASSKRPTPEAADKRYAVAAKMLIGRIKTWFVFPEWFYLNEPVNTLTEPRPTPGGLVSQYSSVGHYDLADDEALVLDRPARHRAVPRLPARHRLVHLARLRPAPDLAQRPPGAGRPRRPDPHRGRGARSGRRQLGGAAWGTTAATCSSGGSGSTQR